MNILPVMATKKKDTKVIEYQQDDITYTIEFGINLNNAVFCIKNKNKIDSFYNLEISFEDIQKKNPMFKVYQTIQEFINSLEGLIKNKNVSIQESEESLTLNIIVFNMINGNKENVSFVLHKKENNNKDEVIKFLCSKVNDLEKKLDEMNKNYLNLKKMFDDLKKIVLPDFKWIGHTNCQLFDNGLRIKKIQKEGWNTGIKANNLLKRNEVNIFKIKVNHINNDKTGLEFGIAKYSSNVEQCGTDWLMSCHSTKSYKYSSFAYEQINKGDIMTFIADLKNGTLEVLKNDKSLGKLHDIPKNEDLVPCASIYYVDDELEIVN